LPRLFCPITQCMPYRDLYGRTGIILAIEPIGFGKTERWLCNKARL
jgi:hypothetical protein